MICYVYGIALLNFFLFISTYVSTKPKKNGITVIKHPTACFDGSLFVSNQSGINYFPSTLEFSRYFLRRQLCLPAALQYVAVGCIWKVVRIGTGHLS